MKSQMVLIPDNLLSRARTRRVITGGGQVAAASVVALTLRWENRDE